MSDWATDCGFGSLISGISVRLTLMTANFEQRQSLKMLPQVDPPSGPCRVRGQSRKSAEFKTMSGCAESGFIGGSPLLQMPPPAPFPHATDE